MAAGVGNTPAAAVASIALKPERVSARHGGASLVRDADAFGSHPTGLVNVPLLYHPG